MPVPRFLHTLHDAQCFSRAPSRSAMGRMTCFSHSGVAEVLGALDVFRGVPGGAKHFEALDDFERVPAGVASPGPSNSLKMSALASSRVWNSCVKEKNESVSMMQRSVAH